MVRRRYALLAATVLAGCGPAVHPIEADLKHFQVPRPNEQARAELGNPVIDEGTVVTIPGIALDAPVTWGDGMLVTKFTVPAEVLFARDETDQDRFYYASGVTVQTGLESYREAGGLKVSRDLKRWALFHGGNAESFGITPPPYRLVEVERPSRLAFRRELLYDGRSGDVVRFTYREFSDDLARPAFTQAVEYDLRDGMTVGFKGARCEIIAATNTELVYTVRSGFASADPAR